MLPNCDVRTWSDFTILGPVTIDYGDVQSPYLDVENPHQGRYWNTTTLPEPLW